MIKCYIEGTCEGTCEGPNWRDEFLPMLRVPYFMKDVRSDRSSAFLYEYSFTDEDKEIKNNCDYWVHVITPSVVGYEIFDLSDSILENGEKVLFCYLGAYGGQTLNNRSIKGLQWGASGVRIYGGKVFKSLDVMALFLNNMGKHND